jgi:hypothetical protein
MSLVFAHSNYNSYLPVNSRSQQACAPLFSSTATGHAYRHAQAGRQLLDQRRLVLMDDVLKHVAKVIEQAVAQPPAQQDLVWTAMAHRHAWLSLPNRMTPHRLDDGDFLEHNRGKALVSQIIRPRRVQVSATPRTMHTTVRSSPSKRTTEMSA